ncbi:MAG: EAL domain-containing protein [Sphingobacteriia bacterium]|nr:EAL domain-containing protein [Sphingobacteriia bacterium]NCC38427.1 EAL domain-containing protein [Gammaproteobacteria bacterium]
MRLICLDDDPRIERILGHFLVRLGHHVEFHATSASFKSALDADDVDVALLDLGLGLENGIEVIRWLAETHPSLPVVLLSGHGDGLLDTARRIANAHGIQVLGTVTKLRMVTDLPAILAREAASDHASSRIHARASAPSREPLTRDELLAAIAARAVIPYLQPIVSPISGRLKGAEVLARLHPPGGRFYHAGEFIPLAESSDLIYPLTEALFEALIQEQSRLAPLGMKFLSVNLSPLILQEERAIALVRRLVEGFDGLCAIRIEMTESAAIAHPDALQAIVAQIRLLGVSLAMDDFGTGYSSMRVLAELPFKSLKIDLSFVSEMFDSPKALRLLRAMINFGKSLDLQVVAEGVETAAQCDLLISEGIDLAQGYLFGAPMTTEMLVQRFMHERLNSGALPDSRDASLGGSSG